MAHTSVKSDNWEVAACGSVGGGPAITGGVWVFQFRNRSLNQRATVGFAGPGVGFGLRAGGSGDHNLAIEDDDFMPLDTVGPMSIDDLNGATGWINSFDVAVGPIGYGGMLITANNMRGSLFGFQPVHSPATGLAGSVNYWTVGVWGVSLNSGIRPYLIKREPIGQNLPPWTRIKCRVARQSISVGLGARVHYHYDAPVPMPGESVMTP